MIASLEPGATYTFQAQSSGWASGHTTNEDEDNGKAVIFLYFNNDGNDGYIEAWDVNTDVITFTNTKKYNYVRVRFNTYSNNGNAVTAQFWNLKLEEGTKATPWVSDLNFDNKQGIFLNNGNLEINASKITTGYLSANRIKAGAIVSENWKEPEEITSEDELNGLKIDLDEGALIAPSLIMDASKYQLNMSSSNGLQLNEKLNDGTTPLLFEAGRGGVIMRSNDYSAKIASITGTQTLTKYVTWAAKRDVDKLRVRKNPSTTAQWCTMTATKGEILCSPLEDDGTILNDGKWISIYCKLNDAGKYEIVRDSLNSDDFNANKYVVGYFYKTGTSGGDIFGVTTDEGNSIQTLTEELQTEATTISGSQVQIASQNSYLAIGKNNDSSKYILIGNSPDDSDYALQIGQFKVTWEGKVANT